MKTAEILRSNSRTLKPHLNEKSIRLWAALEAKSFGHGGVTLLHEVTGLSRSTITRGIDQVKTGQGISRNNSRQRPSGGGRKTLVSTDKSLIKDLKKILENNTRGDPMTPLLWTDKSTRTLAAELKEQGQKVSEGALPVFTEANFLFVIRKESIKSPVVN